jgi:hypothetical protein
MASEDPERASNEKSVLPINPRSGERTNWPTTREPTRKGGVN